MSQSPPIAFRKAVEDIIQRQGEVLGELLEVEDRDNWEELKLEIFKVGLGQLSRNTRLLLTYFSKYELWRIKEAKETLYDYLIFDFQNAIRSLLNISQEEPMYRPTVEKEYLGGKLSARERAFKV
ncbi:MAG: hypothetical protein J7L47_08790 [Candidatus Odinarchaeota archaeon]|nr:hypothetical protein [Candidatus Odinarchaeota archaeon]